MLYMYLHTSRVRVCPYPLDNVENDIHNRHQNVFLGMMLVTKIPIMMSIRRHELNVHQKHVVFPRQMPPRGVQHRHMALVAPTEEQVCPVIAVGQLWGSDCVRYQHSGGRDLLLEREDMLA